MSTVQLKCFRWQCLLLCWWGNWKIKGYILIILGSQIESFHIEEVLEHIWLLHDLNWRKKIFKILTEMMDKELSTAMLVFLSLAFHKSWDKRWDFWYLVWCWVSTITLRLGDCLLVLWIVFVLFGQCCWQISYFIFIFNIAHRTGVTESLGEPSKGNCPEYTVAHQRAQVLVEGDTGCSSPAGSSQDN